MQMNDPEAKQLCAPSCVRMRTMSKAFAYGLIRYQRTDAGLGTVDNIQRVAAPVETLFN